MRHARWSATGARAALVLLAAIAPAAIAQDAKKRPNVVMILADDLISAGLLDVHHTDPVEIELSMLTKMIERVRAI